MNSQRIMNVIMSLWNKKLNEIKNTNKNHNKIDNDTE